MTTDELTGLRAFIADCERLEKDIYDLQFLLNCLESDMMKEQWKHSFSMTAHPGDSTEIAVKLRSDTGSIVGDEIRKAVVNAVLKGRDELIEALRQIPKP